MKILYGIQGTGNGHISRALEIIPALKEVAEVDLLISGSQSELELPYEIKYRCHGLGFVFGKKGGIDLLETYKKSRLKKFYREVKELPVKEYDIVISDFEPITAWASIQNHKTCIGLSNQASLLSPFVPKSGNEDFVGRFIIRNYAPCAVNFGLSYEAYEPHIFTPVIRPEIRNARLSDEGHYTVYLPSYSDEKIIKVLSQVQEADWQVFSKTAIEESQHGNVKINKLNKERFEQSIASASGIVTAAGFGTTTEALFMGKKLLVIPQKNQYEQACNALALKKMGVRVVKSLKKKHLDKISYWVDHGVAVHKDYPSVTSEIVDAITTHYQQAEDAYLDYITRDQYLLKTA